MPTPTNAPYTWEIQRRWFAGLWSHQHILGEHKDPRGSESSDLDPDAFARGIAAQHQPEGEWRVMVWNGYGVGNPPVAIYDPNAGDRG